MSYRALYRQYRPALFSEVIGQEHITTILKNQVKAGQTAHAYLFSGTRGTGKTSTAKILARAVNCLEPEEGEPCGHCAACLRTAVENVDIAELDAASNNGVEDVRAILDKVRYTPLELRTKVYIIDEAHALSSNAFNALLKTLEEPPGHVMFILATTEPQRIPATIISRCQRFDFHRLSISQMTAHLQTVLQSVGAHIDEGGLSAIARAAGGGMRDALSLADQCLSFCGDKVSAADVFAVLGSMDGEFLYTIADALIDSDPARALALFDQVVRDGRDLRVFVHDLALHLRALLIAKLCGYCSDILDCTEDAMARYLAQAERAGEMRLLRANELLLSAEARLKNLALPRVLIESTLVRIARPEDTKTLDDLLERVEALEQRPVQARASSEKREEAPAAPAKATKPARQADAPPWEEPEEDAPPLPEPPPLREEEMPAAEKKAPAPAPVGNDPAAIWARVTALLDKENKPVAIMARAAKRCSLSEGVLEVGFDSSVYHTALTKPANLSLVTGFLEQAAPGVGLKLTQGGGQSEVETRARALFGDTLKIE